ncbi:MAG: pitrilysin family protein [archaeon]|nr:pitrilysin family protein [archaeon]
MTVVFEKRELPLVSLSITNKFGAAFEESEIKGIAHVMEHLLFTGTKTRTHEDISREIEKKGGILNAFTSQEVTSFWFKLPSEHIFSGLDIFIDTLNNSIFNPEKFEKEKRVILEEIKMYHDTPMRFVYDMVEANLYGKPFGESVIGSEKTVSSLKRDFVVDFFNKMYSPENYIVTIVGNADFDAICVYLEKNFSKGNVKLKEKKISLKNEDRVEEREGIDQAHFLFAFHAPLVGTPEYYALEILDAYLAKGMSSKLFLKIREDKGLAYAVKSSINAERNYSYYSIYVGTLKDKIPEVKKIILEELENVKNMTEKELAEAKQMLIGLRRLASEDSDSVMNELLFAELNGDAERYYKFEENIKKVTLEQVKKLAKIKKYSTAAIVPK